MQWIENILEDTAYSDRSESVHVVNVILRQRKKKWLFSGTSWNFKIDVTMFQISKFTGFEY